MIYIFTFILLFSSVLNAKVKVPPNCEKIKVVNDLSVSLCKSKSKNSNKEIQAYDLSFHNQGKKTSKFEFGLSVHTDDPNSFYANSIKSNLVGVEMSGHECTNYFVFDVAKEKNIFDTGCWQPFYFTFKKSFKNQKCLISLNSGDGSGSEIFNICRGRRVLDTKLYSENVKKGLIFWGTLNNSNSALFRN